MTQCSAFDESTSPFIDISSISINLFISNPHMFLAPFQSYSCSYSTQSPLYFRIKRGENSGLGSSHAPARRTQENAQSKAILKRKITVNESKTIPGSGAKNLTWLYLMLKIWKQLNKLCQGTHSSQVVKCESYRPTEIVTNTE